MIAETGILDLQSHGLCRSGNYDEHLARLVPFATAGIYALAGDGPWPAARRAATKSRAATTPGRAKAPVKRATKPRANAKKRAS
jgi:hypothetical protein